jgi:OmpA-OmpF porin, OOP family
MKLVFWSLFFCLATVPASGSFFARTQDVDGGKDHPAVSRMPNYQITEYEQKEFDAHDFPLGGEKTQTVEGRKTVIQYQPAEGATPASGLQIRRNHSNAVIRSGGRVVFEDGENIVLTAAGKAGGEVWMHVWNTGVGDDTGGYKLTIVEREAMRQAVVASDLLSALNSAGRIALYINFDTGKASIEPDSMAAVGQIAAMMKDNPGLRIAVEGHTDDVGDPKSNQALSEQRARAVMSAIVRQGVDAGRLTAAGYGQARPIADNKTEEGRAKNRRVELVKL